MLLVSGLVLLTGLGSAQLTLSGTGCSLTTTAPSYCAQSANYPANYTNLAACTVTATVANGVNHLSFSAFSTESVSYDYITLNTVRYGGTSTPPGTTLRDGATFTWTTDSSVVSSGWKACLVASARTASPTGIIATGGITAKDTGTVLSSTEVLGPSGWAPSATMRTTRHYHACVTLGDSIYAIAGQSITSTPASHLDSVEVLRNDVWSVGPRVQTSRSHHAACAFQGKVWIFGGETSPSRAILSSVEYLDGGSWMFGPSMRVGRRYPAAVALAGSIIVMGGRTASGPLSSIEIFDGVSWSTGASMIYVRSALSAAVINGVVYAAGGENADGTMRGSLETYSAGRWTEMTAGRLQTARSRHCLAVDSITGVLYALGGEGDGNVMLSSTEKYEAGRWTFIQPMRTTRYAPGCASMPVPTSPTNVSIQSPDSPN